MIYQNNKILIVKIPEFKTKFEISHSRRAKYYKPGDKIPKKYQNPEYYGFRNNYLCELPMVVKVVKNTRVAGTPKYWTLNGQS